MPWYLVVRALFVLAVTYAALPDPAVQSGARRSTSPPALALGVLMIVVETRLRERARSPICSAR